MDVSGECRWRALGGLTDVTHIFCTAYQDRPSWGELVPPNLAMLVNTVDAVEPIAPRLRHINLMQQMSRDIFTEFRRRKIIPWPRAVRDVFVGWCSGSGTAWRRSVE
jgi:hypothetical protein